MNRNEEYWALVAQLSDTPPELEGTVERARASPSPRPAGASPASGTWRRRWPSPPA